MKRIVLFSLLALLTACNTMEGAGQDISNGGHKLSKEAEENK